MKLHAFACVAALLIFAPASVTAQVSPDSASAAELGALMKAAMRQLNPARIAVELRDSLQLSEAQVRDLEAVASRSDSIFTRSMEATQRALRDLPQPGDSAVDERGIRDVYRRRAEAEADFFIAGQRARHAIARTLTAEQRVRFDAELAAQRFAAMGVTELPPPSPRP